MGQPTEESKRTIEDAVKRVATWPKWKREMFKAAERRSADNI